MAEDTHHGDSYSSSLEEEQTSMELNDISEPEPSEDDLRYGGERSLDLTYEVGANLEVKPCSTTL